MADTVYNLNKRVGITIVEEHLVLAVLFDQRLNVTDQNASPGQQFGNLLALQIRFQSFAKRLLVDLAQRLPQSTLARRQLVAIDERG